MYVLNLILYSVWILCIYQEPFVVLLFMRNIMRGENYLGKQGIFILTYFKSMILFIREEFTMIK